MICKLFIYMQIIILFCEIRFLTKQWEPKSYPVLDSAENRRKRKIKQKIDSKYNFSVVWLGKENKEKT